MKLRLFFFVMLTLNVGGFQGINCLAQASDSYTVWLLPSAQYRTADSTIFSVQPGWNPQLNVGLLYANSTLKANHWLAFHVGYMFLSLPGEGNDESTFMNGFTLKFPIDKFVIDNQNLVWNRFRSIHDSYHFDRNRTRLLHAISIHRLTISPYLFEEFWFYFTSKTITRLGILVTIKSRLSFDLLFTKQWYRFDGNTNVLFLRSDLMVN